MRILRNSRPLSWVVPLLLGLGADSTFAQWEKTFGGAKTDLAVSVQQTADGGYIVAGSTTSYCAGCEVGDAYLIKLDEEGELDPAWGDAWPDNPKTFGGARSDYVFSVQQTADGGYIVAGSTTSYCAGCEVGDAYLIKLDEEGELDPAWGDAWPDNPKTFGGAGFDYASSVQQTADGGYIVAGGIESFGAGGFDAYLIKLAPVPGAPAPAFLRGDCNGDGNVEGQVTDAVFLLSYNFLGGEEPPCLAACDANGDGRAEGQVTDAVYLLTFNFLAGPAPVEPFPDCGAGPLDTDETLGCETPPESCR